MERYLESLMKIVEDAGATNNERLAAAELYLKGQILLYLKEGTHSNSELEVAASLFGLTVSEDVLDRIEMLRGV